MSTCSIADIDDGKAHDSKDRGTGHEQGMLVFLKSSIACSK